MESWFIALLLVLGISASLVLRIALYHRSPELSETKPSMLSSAIQSLVATAGGVYLALVMLFSFLKLDLPDKIPLFGCALDPLASLSLALAVVQPLVLRLFYRKGSR